MRSLMSIFVSLVVVGAFGGTALAQSSRGVFVRGERRIYPLLPAPKINKPLTQMQKEDADGRVRFSRFLDGAIPQKRDLLKYLTPVRDQGKRGTCVAFASTALVETLLKVRFNRDVDLSEQFSYWTSKALPGGAFPNSDGSLPIVMLSAISHYGIVKEEELPYQPLPWFQDSANHPDCVTAFKADPENMPTQCVTNGNAAQGVRSKAGLPIENAQETSTDPNTIIGFLLAGVPVEVGMSVFQKAWGFDNPKGAKFRAGVVTLPETDDKEIGGHAVLIVGYDLTTKTYLFKNSWGTDEWASTSSHPGIGVVPFTYIRQYAHGATAKLANRQLPW